MHWVFCSLMAIYAVFCFVFAFVEPPNAIRSFFRVPGIFVFLPDRWVMPAGRIFVGICSLVVVAILIVKLS